MIRELIRAGESKTVEFKADFPQKNQIPKTVCAFANRAGGYIIIGVNDKSSVIGVDESRIDDYLDRISNSIHDCVFPMLIPEIYTYKIDNKTVVVIRIYPGNTPPYYLKSEGKVNGTYIRVGKTNKAADNEILQELERRRLNKAFDEDIFREIDEDGVADLSDLLENVLGKRISDGKLESLNLIVPDGNVRYFSNAAGIILGEMEHCRIKCARFMGDSVLDFIDRKEYSGDIFGQLNAAIGFIKSHINIAGVISGNGLKRRDILEIPEEVFREAIVNALIHRDYSISGSDIKIAIYNSRIDVVSPGGLPKSITIEEIYAGRSEVRNKVIAKIFREAGIIEQWGSGIPRIREACEGEGLRAPDLSEDGMYVKLTIYRRAADFAVMETGVRYRFNANLEPDTSKSTAIEAEAEQIFELVKENGNYTVKDLSRLTGLTTASVQRRLQLLQDNKRIVRLGSKKSGRWEMAE